MQSSSKQKKILLLGNSYLVIFGFRKELVIKLIEEGYDVYVSFPNGPFGYGEGISKELGCHFIEIPINRHGKNPFEDLKLIHRYHKLFKKIRPNIVLTFTIKCTIYGGFVSKHMNIPFIPNITGVGKGLRSENLTKKIIVKLYQKIAKNMACIFFQNTSDRQLFIDNKIKFPKERLLPGSGVNLKVFYPLPYPEKGKILFLFIGRVMKEKGIEHFLEAAKTIRSQSKNVEFHILGYCEEEYEPIIKELEKEEIVIYHGLVTDMIKYEKMSNCIVLPSFYNEGMSNVLLEGAACARPLITTKRSGCKEVVEDGVTGLLVKEESSQDLIDKMNIFLNLSHDQQKEMGIRGRRKMEQEFNRDIVINAYLEEITNAVL
jgi:galacturonosyltransferase